MQHYEEVWNAVTSSQMEDKAVETEKLGTSSAEKEMQLEERKQAIWSRKRNKIHSQKIADPRLILAAKKRKKGSTKIKGSTQDGQKQE